MMKAIIVALIGLVGLNTPLMAQNGSKALFPDGSPISSWFTKNQKVSLAQLGKSYVITDFGAKADSTLIQTSAIQKGNRSGSPEWWGRRRYPERDVYERGVIF